jgi:hypothetical protein
MKGLISFQVVIESGDQDANEERGAADYGEFCEAAELLHND